MDDVRPKAVLAEFIGTTLFATFGALEPSGALGNGVLLAVLIYLTAAVSGGHLNPAVTLGFLVTGNQTVPEGIAYIVVQFAGGIVGALLSAGLTNTSLWLATGPGCFHPTGSTTFVQVFCWEFMMTFLLVAVVFMLAVNPKAGHFVSAAPAVIGLALFAGADCGAKYTMGSVNPARTLGPAVVFGCTWQNLGVFVYLAGEFLGGVCGALTVYWAFIRENLPGYQSVA